MIKTGDKKIVFDFKEFRDFLEDLQVDVLGYCGESFYKEFSVSEDGTIKRLVHNNAKIIKPWKPIKLKGEIIKKQKLWLAEHCEIDMYFIFGIFSTEEKAWRECVKHFIKWKGSRKGRYIVNGETLNFGYSSRYKKYHVREIKIDEALK